MKRFETWAKISSRKEGKIETHKAPQTLIQRWTLCTASANICCPLVVALSTVSRPIPFERLQLREQ